MEASLKSAAATGSTSTALPQSPWVYAFGPFRLDAARGLLTYGSEMVPLPQRLFRLLLALIEADGKLVEREHLASVVSPDAPISQANLSQHVYMLRRVLGERARDRLYIMTAHNKGFRFAQPVSIVAASSRRLRALSRRFLDGSNVRDALLRSPRS